LVSRSKVPGGIPKTVDYIPTALTGKDGLFTIVNNMITTKQWVWPQKEVQLYNDTGFNGGNSKVVPVNKPDLGAIFTDFDMAGDGIDPETGIFKPNGKTPLVAYYVIQSVFGVVTGTFLDQLTAGPRSQEIAVTIRVCSDTSKLADVVENRSGELTNYEVLTAGVGTFGSWSMIQVQAMIPFLPEVVKILNRFLDSLRGMVTDAADSFATLAKQIIEKINNWIGIINTITRLIKEIEKLLIGPTVSFLWVPPDVGGTEGFIERVRSAQPAPGQKFTGPSGMTMGITLVIGVGIPGLSDEEKAAYELQFTALEKTFGIIKKLFS
jgi:hypothetical protein